MLHSTHSSPLRGLREEERRGKIESWRELKKKKEKKKEGENGESDRKMPTERAFKKNSRQDKERKGNKEMKESKKERRRKQNRRITQWRREKEKHMFASHLQWRRTA